MAVLALALAIQTGGAPLRAAEVEDLLREVGPTETLAALEVDESLWKAVLDGIASGHPSWLVVGRELRRHTGPDASEWLDLALSEALQPAPRAVLEIADETVWQVDDFCGTIGFAERGASDGAMIARYLDSRRDALLTIDAPELASRREQCLAQIAATRQDLLGTGDSR